MARSETAHYPHAQRVAIVGDTHDTIVGIGVFDTIRPAIGGVDLILHTGDLSSPEALDVLGAIAPVLAVRSRTDPEAAPPTLVEGPRTVVVGAYRIELRNKLDESEIIERDDVDAVVFSAHQPSLRAAGATMFLSPGSPAISDAPSVVVLQLDSDQPVPTFHFLAPE